MSNDLKLRIDDTAYPGKGLARHEGMAVFVPGALPGECVKARITRRQKRFAEARIIEVLEASPHRQTPACPLTGVCPGCCYQHATYKHEVELKQAQFASMLGHHAKVEADRIAPPVAAPAPLEYRNKMVVHVRRGNDERPVIGYFGADNRTVFDVPRCPLAVRAVSELLAQVRDRGPDDLDALEVASIEFRQTARDGAVLRMLDRGGRLRRLEGPEMLAEETGIGPMSVPFGSFFQVHPAVSALVVGHVQSLIRERKPDRVADLYCGVGVFAAAAGLAGVRDVRGVDSDPGAIGAAMSNAAALGVGGARFAVAGAAEGLDSAMSGADAGRTMAIVDPPRRGLDNGTMAGLVRRRPGTIVYVSCGPDTLVRDIGRLRQGSYEVTQSRLFDMFPRTSSFESVTVLDQRHDA